MFAAASFMYITVTHILPEIEIVQTGSTESFELRLFLVIIGLLLGWFSMMLLAIFETEVSQLFAWRGKVKEKKKEKENKNN